MSHSMEQQATLIAESWSGIGGGDPAVLHLGTVRIEVRVLSRTLEHHKLTALLMDVKAAF